MLDEAKRYLRLDEDYTFEDADIQFFINVAKVYLKNATSKEFDEDNDLHKMIVLAIVVELYENRISHNSSVNDFNRIIKSMILQASFEDDKDE